MRLHTKLSKPELLKALAEAQIAGHITQDVMFIILVQYRSRSSGNSFEVQLGTYDKHSLPPGTVDQHGKTMHVRKFKNSGSAGADTIWAATYDEWGWFIAAIFEADPDAVFGALTGPGHAYRGLADFTDKTEGRFG